MIQLLRQVLFLSCLVFIGNSLPASCTSSIATSPSYLVALDSIQAAQAIIKDTKDGFFDQVGLLDMSLQVQSNWPAATTRNAALQSYQKTLQQSVQSFTAQEAKRLIDWTLECIKAIEEIAPSIVPDTIQLIQVNGKAYGDYTFYTREKCIIIPAEAVRSLPEQQCKQVLMHELFHIISRYQPKLRQKLYELVGFIPIEDPVIFSTDLAKFRLLNPDGIDVQWGIQLAPKGQPPVFAQVVIHSRYPSFIPRRPHFFNYLQTNLFALSKTDTGWEIGPEDEALPQAYWEAFFARITDNTDYIIHPDEIMADNFVYTFFPEAKPDPSPAGANLLKQVREVLAQF